MRPLPGARRPLPALVLAVLLLGACGTLPEGSVDHSEGHGAVQDFALSGRLALRQPERSDLVHLDWRHQGDEDRIVLSSPLGSQVMLLEERPGQVRLTLPDRAPVEAVDDAALMQSLVGYSLPVRGMAAWVTGRLPEAARTAQEGAGAERVERFRQDGWDGSLQRWRPVGDGDLPGLIVVTRDGLQLRLVVDSWTVSRHE